MSGSLYQGDIRCKHSTGMFPKSQHSKRHTRAERSCSLRPRKAVAFLTHLLRAPKSKGAGSFAVCGQRLRGHVPSKNTSPAALSWSSLFGATVLESFCSCTMLFVQPDRAFCFCPMRFQTKKGHGAPCPFSASNPAKRKNARKLMLPSI